MGGRTWRSVGGREATRGRGGGAGAEIRAGEGAGAEVGVTAGKLFILLAAQHHKIVSGLVTINVTGDEAGVGVGGTDGTRGVGAGGSEGGQYCQENENYLKESM